MYKQFLSIVLCTCSLCFSFESAGQSPGGVINQSVWLKEKSFSNFSRTGTLNFHPGPMIGHLNAKFSLDVDKYKLRRVTIFTVFKNVEPTSDGSVWNIETGKGDLALSTKQLSVGDKVQIPHTIKENENSIDPGSTAMIHTFSGNLQAGVISSQNESNNIIQFGVGDQLERAGSNISMIAEFILFDRVLTEKEIAKVETYLALKYGITLQRNYINTSNVTLWDLKANRQYSNNIAGIARDDQAFLYQKQSTSFNNPEGLVISAGKLSTANDENRAVIPDKTFFVWGDNGLNPSLEVMADTATKVNLSSKKWLMQVSGDDKQPIPTELRINSKKFTSLQAKEQSFCLAVDRSGTGIFQDKDCDYFKPDSITGEGEFIFNNILWDMDRSGKDVFTFGVTTAPSKKPVNEESRILSFKVFPNPVTNGKYNVDLKLNGKDDIKVLVMDAGRRIVETKTFTGRSHYQFAGFIHNPAGAYTIKVITSGEELSTIILVK
jgi:hypothetical protein